MNEPKGQVIKCGFLLKRSKYLHLWKTRFCILTNHYLFEFTGVEKDADCTMTLLLEDCIDVKDSDKEIGKSKSFCIKTKKNVMYYFRVEEENERDQWIASIHQFINKKIDRDIIE